MRFVNALILSSFGREPGTAIRLLAMFICGAFAVSPAAAGTYDREETPGDCRRNDEKFNSEEGGCLDFSTGVVWSAPAPRTGNYREATQYCSQLDEGTRKDWSLPKRTELLHLSRTESGARDYLSFRFRNFFWTSVGNSNSAVLVELHSQEVANEDKETFRGGILCHRKPSDVDGDHVPDSSDKCNRTPSSSRVVTVGDRKGCAREDSLFPAHLGCKKESAYFRTAGGGCRNLRTGLVWSLPASERQRLSFAAHYCDRLVEGWGDQTHEDWRLPTADELRAISGNELAGQHFKFDVDRLFWTSTEVYVPTEYANLGDYVRYSVRLSNGDLDRVTTATIRPTGNYYQPDVTRGLSQNVSRDVICVRR